MSLTDAITKRLKSKTILTRKPLLKLMPNHLNTEVSRRTRHWPSQIRGTAVSDDNGWYKPQPDKKGESNETK